ncbi:sterile alpha motif domain-containing protein 14 isoform X2 [Platichthys flesus]|uniref:sterile alpha motif domain-containing protein 14 isoform X2 n=1 Tax=Platichthys flesus TaxID=8260 RepID=UPI002DB802F6|nr:sterile alpha motif domain-containing protein 14 isoform X2 [Platichthys flesus]
MSTDLDDTDNVFDLNEAIPETELLDNNIQKGRAQLSIKARRHRPSRSCHRDSLSLTEGDDDDRKDSQLNSACSPLHLAMRGSSPPPDSLLSARSPAFSFNTSLTPQVRHSPEDGGASLAATPRGRYHQLTNATSQEALTPPRTSPSKSCPSSKTSPVYMRRNRRPDSEVLVSDTDTSPSDPGSPTRVFDKKTKRRFLDLGVTLRRSYVRVRTEQNRLSVRDQSPSRSFVPLSWFTEGRGSVTPPPKAPPLSPPTPRRAHSQESVLSEEFSPPHSSPPPVDSCRSSHPYHTLFSDEAGDETSGVVSSWTTQQVCLWLQRLNMEKYVPEFNARNVDGQQLLQMDGSRLKGLGVLSSADRCTLKRRIKEIHAAAEKQRKVLDKLEKQKAKQCRKEQEQRRS